MVNSSTNKLILAFVLLILGIVFISQIASLGQDVTTTKTVTNEVHTIGSTYATGGNTTTTNPTTVYTTTKSQTGWRTLDCPLTNFVLTNSSGSVLAEGASNGYVLTESTGTWVLRDTAGTLNWRSNGAGDNQTLVSYSYCGDDYINSGWGRTGINLVPGFFALALLLISVGLFYSVAKEEGIV